MQGALCNSALSIQFTFNGDRRFEKNDYVQRITKSSMEEELEAVVFIDDVDDNWVAPKEMVTTPINIGDSVKISNGCERFFVDVLFITREGTICGRIINWLLLTSEYNYGDLVYFRKEHIWIVHLLKDLDKRAERAAKQVIIWKHMGYTRNECLQMLMQPWLI